MSDNVYKKLQKCRVGLKKIEIKESGNNKFAGYTYMELGDFLPHIVDLCNEHGLCPVVSFGADEATLTIVNSDAPEDRVVFSSPMSEAELKGCHKIQNLGAVETYLRRYLYVAAFDIVEHDALDSTQGKEKPEKAAERSNSSSGASSSSSQGTLSPDQHKYFPRVKTALDALFGEDMAAKKAEIKKLTTFPGKDGKEVSGVEDYRKLDGKRLQILCAKLEKQNEEGKREPDICAQCGQPVNSGGKCNAFKDCPNNINYEEDIPL